MTISMSIIVNMLIALLLNNIIVMADVSDSNTGVVFLPYDNDQKDTKMPNLNENTMVEKQIEGAVDGMLYLLLVPITLEY